MPIRSQIRPLTALVLAACLGLAACGGGPGSGLGDAPASRAALHPNETPELRRMIERAAHENGVPVELVQRVVIRESRHNPAARNGPYYGLMQILPQTARTMGFRGEPAQLLDPETNLRYGVRYLRGAWLVADGNPDRAVSWYARGYYYEAKRKGLLEETGLR
jgi:soluble lytic murein transglycosylase-like protein